MKIRELFISINLMSFVLSLVVLGTVKMVKYQRKHCTRINLKCVFGLHSIFLKYAGSCLQPLLYF